MDVNIIIDEPRFAVHHLSRETIPLPPGKKFHIFFSYRDVPRDKLWVKRVIGKLETEYGYTCCDHERDFLPGTKIMDNIKDGVKNSEKVVVVFSKEAVDRHYVSLEAEMAYRLSLEKRKNLLIPVLLDDCDVPEEFMLLTYIDAREGVEETTWWHKLIMAIESTGETSRSPFHVEGKNVAAGKTFSITHRCSIETKYNFLRCSIQRNSKYIPEELRPQSFGVTADLIRATYKDLLQCPRVVCRQKCYWFATISVFFGYLIFAVLLFLCIVRMIYCVAHRAEKIRTGCIMYVIACFLLLLISGVCHFGCKKYYVKNPNSVHKNIIDYNRILSKYGIMVTVLPGHMWKTASLIFYQYRFELCKEYVLRHLVKEESSGTTERIYIPDSDPMMAPTEDLPLLSGVREPHGSREKKALELLMSCTPEYLDLAYADKLKNPKEDRHGIEFLCLCQYLEKVDKDFREKVKRTRSLRLKTGIKENYQDEANAHVKNLLLD